MDKDERPRNVPAPRSSAMIDWYSEGETKQVEFHGVQVTVRFIGRRGRRARIAIEAPPGAVFRAVDRTT